jgi:hypothetical protein
MAAMRQQQSYGDWGWCLSFLLSRVHLPGNSEMKYLSVDDGGLDCVKIFHVENLTEI